MSAVQPPEGAHAGARRVGDNPVVVVPSDVDLRGFVDPLEALRQIQAHRLDAARLSLARCDADLADARRCHAGLVDRLHELGGTLRRQAATSTCWPLDGGGPRFMAALSRKVARSRERLDHALAAVRAARDELDQVRLQCEALERHRDLAVQAFAQTQRARAACERDQDWLARHAWRQEVVAPA